MSFPNHLSYSWVMSYVFLGSQGGHGSSVSSRVPLAPGARCVNASAGEGNHGSASMWHVDRPLQSMLSFEMS